MEAVQWVWLMFTLFFAIGIYEIFWRAPSYEAPAKYRMRIKQTGICCRLEYTTNGVFWKKVPLTVTSFYGPRINYAQPIEHNDLCINLFSKYHRDYYGLIGWIEQVKAEYTRAKAEYQAELFKLSTTYPERRGSHLAANKGEIQKP